MGIFDFENGSSTLTKLVGALLANNAHLEPDLKEDLAEAQEEIKEEVEFSDFEDSAAVKTVSKASEGAHTTNTRKAYLG